MIQLDCLGLMKKMHDIEMAQRRGANIVPSLWARFKAWFRDAFTPVPDPELQSEQREDFFYKRNETLLTEEEISKVMSNGCKIRLTEKEAKDLMIFQKLPKRIESKQLIVGPVFAHDDSDAYYDDEGDDAHWYVRRDVHYRMLSRASNNAAARARNILAMQLAGRVAKLPRWDQNGIVDLDDGRFIERYAVLDIIWRWRNNHGKTQ